MKRIYRRTNVLLSICRSWRRIREALVKMRNHGALLLGEKTWFSFGDKVSCWFQNKQWVFSPARWKVRIMSILLVELLDILVAYGWVNSCVLLRNRKVKSEATSRHLGRLCVRVARAENLRSMRGQGIWERTITFKKSWVDRKWQERSGRLESS